MWKESLKQYRGIFISTTGFMLFFIGYLFLNSALQSTSVKATHYASYVAQLGTQAGMLTGRVSADRSALLAGLDILNSGGAAEMADGTALQLEPLDAFLVSGAPDLSDIKSSLNGGDFAAAEAAVIDLRGLVQAELARKVRLVDTLQVIVGIFTLLLYAMITFQLIRRLSQSEQVDVKAKQEAEGILNTVSEGLFLLGRDHEIGIEQSASLKEMFKQERDLDGNFFDFISQYITQGDLQVAKDYLELLFGDRVKEKLVASLNPLNNVEINIARRDGSFENRYLDFHFKRVLEDGHLKHLLGSVTDVTRQVLLEKELVEAKEEQEAQIDLLKSILHIDNAQLKTFFRTADIDLNNINKTLESHDQKRGQNEIRAMLVQISQDVHKIKGDAAALGLHQFEFSSHEFENAIKEAQSTEKLTGKELLPLTTNLRGMFKDLDNMQTLVDKFSGSFTESSQPDSSAESEPTTESGLVAKVQNLVKTVSDRNNTRTQLTMFGLDKALVPTEIEDDLSSIIVQLTRNAVVHGGDTPEQRLSSNKPDFMSLAVSLTKTSRGYELIVRDDGRGIDEKAIVQRAVDMGLAEKDAVASATFSSCLKYLFHPSFSSETQAGLDAGRGVGLSLVRSILRERNGKISVRSKKGNYCQFLVVLPAKNAFEPAITGAEKESLSLS